MWTNENRAEYDRSRLRYPSDLADPEGDLVAPLIPPARRGGNKWTVDVRAVVKWGDVCTQHRLPVAGAAERPSAAEHRV